MAYKYGSYKSNKKPKDESLEVKAILAFLRGAQWLIMLPFRKRPSSGRATKATGSINMQEVAQRWSDIQTSIGLGGVTHFGAAVVAADRLLDYVLRQKGYPGETMGERLKYVQDDVSAQTYHNTWQAHKLRNRLVHEIDGEILSFQAKEAIQSYEQILRELGALR